MKPKTERDWAFYRVALHCDLGQDVLAGNLVPPEGTTTGGYAMTTPDGMSADRYAMYLLLAAVRELAAAIRGDDGKSGRL